MFTQMGLAMRRTDYQYAVGTVVLARTGPRLDDLEFTWARRENRKHREALNKTLRAFFGIDGDPIELTDDKKAIGAHSN